MRKFFKLNPKSSEIQYDLFDPLRKSDHAIALTNHTLEAVGMSALLLIGFAVAQHFFG